MSTMQSTMERIAAEEKKPKPDPVPGWQPAGPALTEDAPTPKGEIQEGAWQHDILLAPSHNLPSIGHLVVYHLRDGDSRNMRTKFPAVVLDVNQSTGLLSLIITVDAGDEWRQDHVPPRRGSEPGWELVNEGPNELSLSVARLSDRIAALENPDIAEIRERREAMGDDDGRESCITELFARVTALEAKRGPGRPPNPDKPKG